MSDGINVRPSLDNNKVTVATDDISGTHYPIYKLAIGEDGTATLIDSDGLPVQLATAAKVQQEEILEGIENAVEQLKMMNLYLQEMTGLEITKGDL